MHWWARQRATAGDVMEAVWIQKFPDTVETSIASRQLMAGESLEFVFSKSPSNTITCQQEQEGAQEQHEDEQHE